MFSKLWNNPLTRAVAGWVVGAAALVLAVLWVRDDAADDREEEVRDEMRDNVQKQKIALEESQNEQVKEAGDVRRRDTAGDDVPSWMRGPNKTPRRGE